MHELSMAQRLLDLMTETSSGHGGGRVISARLLVGELSCIDAETLRFAFDVVSRGSCAEGCRLDVEAVPLRLRCRSCATICNGGLLDRCPSCGEVGFEVLEGRELRLQSIDLDDTPPDTPGSTP